VRTFSVAWNRQGTLKTPHGSSSCGGHVMRGRLQRLQVLVEVFVGEAELCASRVAKGVDMPSPSFEGGFVFTQNRIWLEERVVDVEFVAQPLTPRMLWEEIEPDFVRPHHWATVKLREHPRVRDVERSKPQQ